MIKTNTIMIIIFNNTIKMKNIAIAIGALAGASAQSEPYNGMCTTMGFGTSATSDGSTMITHTADCKDCDFRLDKTPPANHDLDLNPNRPVYRYRRQYPRLVAEERGSTWQPTNLESEFSSDWSSKEYIDSQIVGYIPQVSHTYGLFESLFAIMNDQQVAIGESTSSARFGENAVPRECPTCPGPLVDVAAISLVALERCKTALCAVEMMGELATKYGYYGAETEEGDRGEALTVSDPTSVYMMHLSPDPTATTAVWVARRVPDNHVTAAANQFVIRGINKDTDLYSKNIFQVAVDAGVAAYDADGNLDFLKSYGVDSQPGPGLLRKSEYTTDRIWRIYSLLAPSKNFHRKTDCYGSDFPFSVEVEFPVTPQFVMNINRDHYSGTELDLTKGFASGPYSNPVRYDPGNGWPDESYAHNENNITEVSEKWSGAVRSGAERSTTHRSTLIQNASHAVGKISWCVPSGDRDHEDVLALRCSAQVGFTHGGGRCSPLRSAPACHISVHSSLRQHQRGSSSLHKRIPVLLLGRQHVLEVLFRWKLCPAGVEVHISRYRGCADGARGKFLQGKRPN